MNGENRSVAEVSREHVDRFLRRERRDLERLADAVGSKPAGKLDRVLARDLVYERREHALAATFGSSPERMPSPDHRVTVMMSSARQAQPRRVPKDKRARRRIVSEMRRSGQRAVNRLQRALDDRPAEILETFWLTHSISVATSSEEVIRLADRGDVAGVTALKPMLALALDASRPLIRADQVESSLGISGKGVRVAVLDTGIDVTHPALAGVVASQQDFTGSNTVGAPAEGIGDGHGHGTHVAGIVASQDRTRRGIAPGVTIDDIKILTAAGTTDHGCAQAGIAAAIAAGVDVASNSWGFSHADGHWQDPPNAQAPDGSCVLCVAADNAAAAGVAFVVAAGNNDDDSCSTYDTHIDCPGNAREAITVAAGDDDDDMADFSSVGPTPQGRAKPDVTAPGVDIASCRAGGTSMGELIDGRWTVESGTSMACPHVAGVVALMLERNPNLTPAQVKGILMSTAVDIGATANEMGAGRVDALAAVNAS